MLNQYVHLQIEVNAIKISVASLDEDLVQPALDLDVKNMSNNEYAFE
jgi:hypothetical protein